MSRLRAAPESVRAAWWTLGAVRLVRRQLAQGGIDAIDLAPPTIPPQGNSGVRVALKLATRNCLVHAAVRQAWCAAQGRRYDLIIGVQSPSRGFKAHAWLSADRLPEAHRFVELARRPARGAPR
jgi:hypothetical protein